MSAIPRSLRVRRAYSVVLLARLVDRDGKLVEPDSIKAIEYSVYRIEESRVCGIRTEPICDGEPLRAADVIFPEPRREPCAAELFNPEPTATEAYGVERRSRWLWVQRRRLNPDGEKYNFRHCFVIPSSGGQWASCSRFEVRYVFTQVTGEKTAVRFRIRATRND